MVINVLSVWMLTSQSKGKRHAGFLLSLLSNLLWVIWGWHVQAFAVLGLQIALATLNIHGVRNVRLVFRNAPMANLELIL